ncbi:E3 ubiquitin-protein ligase mib1 [Mactra antiquata]
MASSQGDSSMISEILRRLNELKKQNSEMKRLLDLLKEKRNGAKVTDTSQETNHTSPREQDRKPKGILKTPKLGDKNSYGFIEQFDLTENNIKYAKKLRRTRVAMNQDNRLCLRYGFEPNIGCQYTKSMSIDSGNQQQMKATQREPQLLEHRSGDLQSLSWGAGSKPTQSNGSLSNIRLFQSSCNANSQTGKLEPDRTTPYLALENRQKAEEMILTDLERKKKALENRLKALENGQIAEEIIKTAEERRQIDEDIPGTVIDRPTNNDDNNDKQDDERILINPAVWRHYAEEEMKRGKYCNEIREKGLDTIFCLDVSSSMKGACWDQAMEFIRNFLAAIQTTQVDSVYEHVALVTFGGETCVQQHFTCDYLEVNRKLDALKPGGPSPLFAGLLMCQAAILGAGTSFSFMGYDMYPRIYLLTDGKFTEAGLSHGPDDYTDLERLEELLILGEVETLYKKYHVVINPVPVGTCEWPLLAKIASTSNGKLIRPDDWEQQSKSFMNYLVVCSIDKNILLGPGLQSLILDLVLPDAKEEDKAQMLEFLETHKHRSMIKDVEVEGLPPLGSRVRHQTSDRLGTVTKHFSEGMVGVTWDTQDREKLTAGSIRVVKEQRILYNELIAVGCRVERGKDWKYETQDGGPGNYGNVYDVTENGIVKVKWDTGGTFTYRYGAEGQFDVQLVDKVETTAGADSRADEIVETAGACTDSRADEILTENDDERRRVEDMNKANKLLADKSNEINGAPSVAPEVTGATACIMPSVNSTKEKRKVIDTNEADKRGNEAITTDKHGTDGITTDKHGTDAKVTDKRSRDVETNDKYGGDVDITDKHNKSVIIDNDNGRQDRIPPNIDNKNSWKQVTSTNAEMSSAARRNVQWMYKDDNDSWILYPVDVNDKIESSFIKHSAGTCVIQLDQTQYRIAFSRMQQINVSTREKVDIKRVSETLV